jgi:hypothetical protein
MARSKPVARIIRLSSIEHVRDVMTLSVQLSAPTEARLKKRAAAAGKAPAEYARALIERDVMAEETFDDILRPAREAFRRTGGTEKDLNETVHHARKHIYRQNRQRRKSK